MIVRIKVDGLEKVIATLDAIPADVAKAVDRTAVDVEGNVLTEVGRHSKTGALERSVFKRRIQGGWEIGNDSQVAPHARWVHDGAHSHVIEPKEKKALRWPVPGGFRFAKRVDHPGYKGDAWLQRAARDAVSTFERHLQALLDKRK